MMKYCGGLFVVEDREKTLSFYKALFGVRVIQDFGANFTMTGGLFFQTRESWTGFIDKEKKDIIYRGNNAEIYFETDDLDSFLKLLETRNDIQYVHPLKVHDWGQRGIRIYDPDGHIIEISETLAQVCQRYMDEGYTVQEISQKTSLSEKIVNRLLKKK